ncbi:MAG: hypothetical protein II343_05590 [Clostridia bacterium]|nr:hypothetical protein [Clostridia bacterium]
MNDQETSRSRSPFSELSFSQQQEMWRVWRAQSLEYKDIKPEPPTPEIVPPPPAPPQPYMPPSHKNLDQVHARIAAAKAHAGAFTPLT